MKEGEKMLNCAEYFKVIVVKIGILESKLVDERHFGNDKEAFVFSELMNEAGYVTIMTAM